MANPSASLYVGDLAPDVDEGMLFTIFISVGPVASVRVCRDNLTRRSLGYAYVNFHSVVDAERALDTLNNTPISGRPCRIMWSQRDPTIRKSGVGNLFIKQLDPNITHKELFDTFSAFGNILSVKVAMDATGQSKGFGFVHFENAESAENAIKTVNDKILGTKRVYVGKFVTKKDRLRQKEQVWTNVFVKDIDPAVTDKDLEAKFAAFGPVTSCVIATNENTNPNNETTRFGFVNFENHEDAVKAVAALHGTDVGTKKIWCGRAQKKAEREQELKKKFAKLRLERLTKFQGINLYIKNLDEDISEERLQNEFAQFGAIRSCKIMFDEKGINKGFGFVCYTTPEEAQRAINEMNNRPLSGFEKPLYVALHEPAELRKQKLAQRHAARTKGVRGESAPLYYTNGNVPSGYVYTRAPARGAVWQYPQPNYPVPHPNAQRGGGGNRSGGRGGNNRGRNARHHQAAGPVPHPVDMGMAGLQPPVAALPELTLQVLSAYPFETQKLLLGERLYPLIHILQPHLAGKITGMLLDSGWPAEELLSLINDEAKLKAKVEEAINVLKNSQPAEVHSSPLTAPAAVEQEVAN